MQFMFTLSQDTRINVQRVLKVWLPALVHVSNEIRGENDLHK
jgi:hypothetical protein